MSTEKKKTSNACPACLLPEYKNSGLEQEAMTAQVSLFANILGRVPRCTFLSLSLSCLLPQRPTPRHSSYVSPSSFACACMANRDLQRDAERKTWASWRESRDKLFCGDLHDLVESVVLRELAKSVPRSAKKKKATMLGLLAAFICCPPPRQTHQHRCIPHRRQHELQHHAGVSSTSTCSSTGTSTSPSRSLSRSLSTSEEAVTEKTFL